MFRAVLKILLRKTRLPTERRVAALPGKNLTWKKAALCLFLCCLFPATLFADIIHLKDGTSFEGFFVSVSGKLLIFRTNSGQVEIPSEKIQRIEILYTGVKVCYQLRAAPDVRNCSGVLHAMSSTKVIIATNDRQKKQTVIKLVDLKELNFRKDNNNQQIMPLLRPGLDIKLLLASAELNGTIDSISKNKLSLKLPDGSLQEVREADLVGGIYYPPLPKIKLPRPAFRYWHLLPGAPQISNDEFKKGYSLAGSFAFLGFEFVSEYMAAKKAAQAASSDLGFIFFNQTKHLDEFNKHQQNQRTIGGVALLLYAYHIFDAFVLGGRQAPRLQSDNLITIGGRSHFRGQQREFVNEIFVTLPL